MKKLYFIFIFFVFCGISIFSDNDAQEEVDFLLFLPNSSNQFVDEEHAFIQLDNLARYLSNKNLVPGQIIVYGYAAFAPNNIEPVWLSRERALFVINELQKRGISKDLFSSPQGYGSVYLWGNNTDEDDRKPNRRVRILLGGETPISITPEIINAEAESVVPDIVHEEPAAPEKTSFKFPWWILLLLPILLLLLPLLKKRSQKPVHKPEPAPVHKSEPIPAPKTSVTKVNLDEEIRFCAYEYFQRRNGVGELREQDWFNGLHDVSALYKSRGYSVYFEGEYWWASIETKYT